MPAFLALALFLVVIVVLLVPLAVVVAPIAMMLGLVGAVVAFVAVLLAGWGETVPPPEEGRPGDPARPGSGSDPAWPGYVHGQLEEDARAGIALVRRGVSGVIAVGGRAVEFYGEQTAPIGRILLTVPLAVLVTVLGAVVLGGGVGIVVACVLLAAVAELLRACYAAIAAGLHLQLAVRRAAHGAGATCVAPGCLAHGPRAVLRCVCGRHHLDFGPGRYGLISRRCACGTTLPHAPERLRSTVPGAVLACGWCRHPLPSGSLRDRDVRVAVVGAPDSGHASFAERAMTGLPVVPDAASRVDPRDPDVTRSVTARVSARGRDGRVHLLDPADGLFDDVDRLDRAHHLRTSQSLVLLVAAAATGRTAAGADRLDRAHVAVHEAALRYHAVIDALDGAGLPLRHDLAIVVIFDDSTAAPEDADDAWATAWLERHGGRNLVRASHRDVRAVRVFALHGDDPASTAAPLRWLAGRVGLWLRTTGVTEAGPPGTAVDAVGAGRR